jgi:hypothetical protein
MVRKISALAIVGVLGAAAPALAAQSGTYFGKTSQPKGSITLKVSRGKVVKVTFADGIGMGSGCSLFKAVLPQFPYSFRSRMTISRSGRFSGRGSPRQQEVFKISGRFTARGASGSFTDTVPIEPEGGHGFVCSSGKVTFTAKLK